ncbi:MAG: ArsA-related P-loop ATPase [Byssovorax sp.]
MTPRAGKSRSSASGPAKTPLVVVCAGGGGVGKTTTSAALALALARQGRTTLIVTIDPARRLAGAMGVPIGDVVTQVALPDTGGRLFALMPDPRTSMRTFVDELFVDQPAAKAHLLANRLFVELSDAAAGVHELVAMNLIAGAAAGGRFEVVVIDTAPSRHAIDFVTYPGRLAALLGGRTIAWLAGVAERATDRAPSTGALSWGVGRIESLLARVTGPHLLGDTASLFGDLARVRERFVALTQHAANLLLGDRTAYVLVVAPTAAARDDAVYLHDRLDKLGRKPHAIVMNRGDVAAASYVRILRETAGISPSLLDAIGILEQERATRGRAAAAFSAELEKALPKLPIVRLPFIEAVAPDDVMMALALELREHVETLLP